MIIGCLDMMNLWLLSICGACNQPCWLANVCHYFFFFVLFSQFAAIPDLASFGIRSSLLLTVLMKLSTIGGPAMVCQ